MKLNCRDCRQEHNETGGPLVECTFCGAVVHAESCAVRMPDFGWACSACRAAAASLLDALRRIDAPFLEADARYVAARDEWHRAREEAIREFRISRRA